MLIDLYGKNPMLWERLSITSHLHLHPSPFGSLETAQWESLQFKEVGRHYKLGLYCFPAGLNIKHLLTHADVASFSVLFNRLVVSDSCDSMDL